MYHDTLILLDANIAELGGPVESFVPAPGGSCGPPLLEAGRVSNFTFTWNC